MRKVVEIDLTTTQDALNFNRVMCNVAEHVQRVSAALDERYPDGSARSAVDTFVGRVPTRTQNKTSKPKTSANSQDSGSGPQQTNPPTDVAHAALAGLTSMRVIQVWVCRQRWAMNGSTTAHHVCSPFLQPSHRVYTASLNGSTVVDKVQPRQDSKHEEHVLKLMADPACHTVKVLSTYDHGPTEDASALVLEHVPYAFTQRNLKPEDVMKRGFQLTEVWTSPSLGNRNVACRMRHAAWSPCHGLYLMSHGTPTGHL